MSEKVTATCLSCGAKHETEAWSRINVADDPELKARVKDGSLFMWDCPDCGKTNLVRYQTLYHDPENRIMIWMLPAGLIPESQVEALGVQIEQSSDLPEGYSLRRVEDIGSLIEKVNIFDSGLDDCVIEMCKYITKMEMVDKGASKDIIDAHFKFYSIEGADTDIVFTYPQDGQMQGLRVGFNVYEDCAGIIRRNPSVKPDPGFSRIDPDWVMRFFR